MDYLRDTPCGPVQGGPGRIPGVAAFKGIRYATARRWDYPTQVTSWEGIYDATAYGPCCYQPRAFYDEEQRPEKSFYFKEFRQGERYTYSEDCLFLNIFTPETAQPGDKLPVLFYIHGGSFTGGCGHEKHFDTPVWPLHGVIGVTINYRLGPLGFLALPELKREAGITGNYGLYDQLTALHWVRDNIASFGGDPENITLMGQSAGAMSVQQHCLSPLSKGLFKGAVLSSGGGVSKALAAAAPDQSYGFWHKVMESLDCMNINDFRSVPVEELFSAWEEQEKKVRGGSCYPCLDGRLIVGTGAELLAGEKQHPIHYLAGITSEDMMPPMLYKMSADWCAAQKVSSYGWFFDRRLPGDGRGAWHSSDLWYWFGTLDNGWRPFEEKDRELSRQMVQYLVNFCKRGDPNGEGLPVWRSMGKKDKKVLLLGEQDTAMGAPSMWKLIKTMLVNKPVGE